MTPQRRAFHTGTPRPFHLSESTWLLIFFFFCAHQEEKRKRGRERRERRAHNSSIGLIKIQSCVTGGDERRPVCVASITKDKNRLLRDKRKDLCPLLLSVDLIFLAQTEPQESNDNQANSLLLAYFYLRNM